MVRPIKPEDVDWQNLGVEPGGAKKTSGHSTSDLDKPTADQFNWFWNVIGRLQRYLYGPVNWNIVIDSNTKEGDFTTLAAYIAGTPAVGDRVLVKESQTLADNITIPDGIMIGFLQGVEIIFTNNKSFILGDDISIVGELVVRPTVSVTAAINCHGSRNFLGKMKVIADAGVVITSAFGISNGNVSNFGNVVAYENGGTVFTVNGDNSNNNSNFVVGSNGSTHLLSNGFKRMPVGNASFSFDLGSDADGDMYYRSAAGELVRLPQSSGLLYIDNASNVPIYTGGSPGDLFYYSGGNIIRLAMGTNGTVLGINATSLEYTDRYARAYFGGVLATDDLWVALSGYDATNLDWTDKRISFSFMYDVANDISTWSNPDAAHSGGAGTLPSGTSRNIGTVGDPINLRANAGSGNLEIQRPAGSRSATTSFSLVVIALT